MSVFFLFFFFFFFFAKNGGKSFNLFSLKKTVQLLWFSRR